MSEGSDFYLLKGLENICRVVRRHTSIKLVTGERRTNEDVLMGDRSLLSIR